MSFRPKDENERILHRLKITRGHLEKVIKMTRDGEYCIDIIHQSQAVQKALKEVDNLMLEQHLKCCTTEDIKKGKTEKAIRELMEVFDKRK